MSLARRRPFAGIVLGAVLSLAFAACVPTKPPAPPAFDRMVDEDGQAAPGNCDASGTAHATIAAAITAAAVDDVIGVCPGTYTEQLTIPNDKDGIVLAATQPRQATIKAPATMAEPGHLVHINGPTDVAITGFVIAGPLPDALVCTATRSGVLVGGGASATIDDNQVTQIRATDPSLRSCDSGIGIRVSQGTGTITNNDLDTYQKSGMIIDSATANAVITDNSMTGDGPIEHISQSGIEVVSGATATIEGNQISDHDFIPTSDIGVGVLLFDPGAVTLRSNLVDANDDNVTALEVLGSTFQNNVLTNATRFDGIFMGNNSTGNVLIGNIAQGNAGVDCQDFSTGTGTSGTANTWAFNLGGTSNPPGLCTGFAVAEGQTATSSQSTRPEKTPAV